MTRLDRLLADEPLDEAVDPEELARLEAEVRERIAPPRRGPQRGGHVVMGQVGKAVRFAIGDANYEVSAWAGEPGVKIEAEHFAKRGMVNVFDDRRRLDVLRWLLSEDDGDPA